MEVIGALSGAAVFIMEAFSLPVNCLLVSYFREKPLGQQTAFDSVLVDTIYSSMYYAYSIVAIYLVYFFCYPNIPILLTSVICAQFYLATAFFLASNSVTISLKYLYLEHGVEFFGWSDFRIRYTSILVKFSLWTTCILLDYYGPIQNRDLAFIILSNGSREFDPILHPGLGIMLCFILMCTIAFLTQRKVDSLNENDEDTKKLAKILTIPAMVTALLFLSHTFVFSKNDDNMMIRHLTLLWIMSVISLILPISVIARNKRISNYLQIKLGISGIDQIHPS